MNKQTKKPKGNASIIYVLNEFLLLEASEEEIFLNVLKK